MPESVLFVPKLTIAAPSRGCLPYIFPELLPPPRVGSLFSISDKHGLPNYLAWATILRGWTLAERGCASEGISEMQDGLIALQATGEQTSSAYHLTVLVLLCHKIKPRTRGTQAEQR
jgi:hypothetical protein